MNYNEAVDFFHSRMRFGVQPGLERIGMLLERLGNPQNGLKYVHVAGTNGKGTTCTFISEILMAAGFRTGLYTSPYVIEFRERIRMNGEMIAKDDLCAVTQRVRTEIEKLDDEGIVITEFEAVTAAAFLYYSQCDCDYVVLETGLGGRFDATNVIQSNECCAIVSVSLDHTAILGDTVEKIAFEKCGIIKNGGNVVTPSSQTDGVLGVIAEQSSLKNASMHIADVKNYRLLERSVFGSVIEAGGMKLTIPFSGVHQIENALTAVECVKVLRSRGAAVSDENIAEGIANAKIPARCEIISREPLVILDGCHNDGSTLALKNVIENDLRGRRIRAVMGMMADKECEKSLSNLLPYFYSVTTVTPSNPRAMKACELARTALQFCDSVSAVDSPVEGVRKTASELEDGDVFITCGSLYLSADVRDELYRIFGK